MLKSYVRDDRLIGWRTYTPGSLLLTRITFKSIMDK